MPEVLFPVFPEGISYINSNVGFKKIDQYNKIVYFNSGGPIYQHAEEDINSFRFITSQLMDLGLVKQVEVIRAFKISAESAKRWLKKYRNGGASAFFTPPKTRKGGTVLTPEVIQEIEHLFRQGSTRKEISEKLEIKESTITKALQEGRIIKPSKKK